MKSYKQMAEDVLSRRDEYESRKRQKRNVLKREIVCLAGCCAAVVLVCGCLTVLPGLMNGQSGATDPVPFASAAADNRKDGLDAASAVESPVAQEWDIVAAWPCQSIGCRLSPHPGEVICDQPVEAAREHYGDREDIRYLLAIDIFKEEGFLSDKEREAEYQRLTEAGYDFYRTTAWTYQGEHAEKVEYPVILGVFSESQLRNFPANERYGYMFRFESNGDSSPLEPREEDVLTIWN